MSARGKGTMKVSPIERITLAAFRLADANRAFRKATADRKEATPHDEGVPCWRFHDIDIASHAEDFCDVCLDAMPILRQVKVAYRERNRAKAYFRRAVAAVKSPETGR